MPTYEELRYVASLPKDEYEAYIDKLMDEGKAIFPYLLARRIWYKKLLTVVVIVGNPRSGKTWIGLSLGEMFDPEIDLSKQYWMSIGDFILNFGKLPPDRPQVIDEAGVGLSADDWGNYFNRAFSVIGQTQAIKSRFYIIILPHIRYLRRAHRYLISYVLRVDYHGKFAVYKVSTDWADFSGDAIYRHFIEYVSGWPPPSERVIEALRKREVEQKDEILKRLQLEVKQRLYPEQVQLDEILNDPIAKALLSRKRNRQA